MRKLNFGHIIQAAHEIHDESSSSDVRQLSELVAKLATECEELEKELRDVYDETRRTKRV